MAVISVNTWVEVDVDLAEIDTDDLVSELDNRDIDLGNGMCVDKLERLGNDLFYALLYGREDKALEAAKRVAEEITGRILT